jgi:uncharacterized metal-binding protein (TIGR02443 family)
MSESPSTTNVRPRFIAGAVCPACKAEDRLVVEVDGESRRCIDCGFSDARPKEAAEPPATRVTRAAARRVETPAEAVRLVDHSETG